MKRWGLLLLALAMAPGCVELDVWLKDKEKKEQVPAGAGPARARVQVNPKDVTEGNAREMLQALGEELSQAEKDQGKK